MCLFCDIAAGKIPSAKVYEDDNVYAFLDLAQVTKGHTLVIPKKHYDNILECDDETLSSMITTTKFLAKKITTNLNASGCNILNNCNEVAGQSVMHVHFHIIPRYSKDDEIKIEFNPTHPEYDLNAIVEEINAK